MQQRRNAMMILALARVRFQSIFPLLIAYSMSGGSLVVSSAAQLLTFAILAKTLGANEFSLFVGIMAVSSIAIHLCGLGGAESLVRRVARDLQIYPALLGHNIILIIASGSVLVIGGSVALNFFFTLADSVGTNLAIIAVMMVTNVVLTRFILLTEQIFIAHSDFISANKVVVGYAMTRTAAAALGCLVFGVSSVAEWAAWQFVAHVVVLLACIRAIRPLGKPEFRIVREEVPLGLYFSVPFILRAVRQNADLLVLSLMTSAEIVASYGIARRMLESSYLAVEAVHRLVYPGSARAAKSGLHNAIQRVRKILLAVSSISVAAAVTVFVCAPILPYLFGAEYVSLVTFVRYLCWLVVPIALWSIPMEAVGASGHQSARALVMGVGSVAGAAIAACATWYAPPTGTFVSFYFIEIAMVIAAWSMFFRLVRNDRRAEDLRQQPQEGARSEDDTRNHAEKREMELDRKIR